MSTWDGLELSDECICHAPDIELVQDMDNMWYHGCYVTCYECGNSTKYFSHNGDQNSGTLPAVQAWNNKEYKDADPDIMQFANDYEKGY